MYGGNHSLTNVAFEPDFDKHESTIYFEPLTGSPIRAQLRIQLNVNAWIDRIRVENDGTEYRFVLEKRNHEKNR